MEKGILNQNVGGVFTMINNHKITFDNPLQRDPGQWDIKQKCLLIDSVLRYFIPDMWALKDTTGKFPTYDIIDGIQRLTTIFDFIDNKFTLLPSMRQVFVETTGEWYDLAGKQFWDLAEPVQQALKAYSLSIRWIELGEDDDEETIVEEIFYRLNNGQPMASQHLALISASKEVQEFVHNMVTSNPLYFNVDNKNKVGVAHFAQTNIKKSDRQMSVLQSLVYLSGIDYKDFSAKVIEQFFKDNTITAEIFEKTEHAFRLIAEAFDGEHNTFMTKVRLSAFAVVANEAIEQGKQEQFKQFTKWYAVNSKTRDEFRSKCGAGNTKKEKCIGRIATLENMFNEFMSNEFTPEISA